MGLGVLAQAGIVVLNLLFMILHKLPIFFKK